MLGVSILPLSTIFLLDCGTVLVFHFIHITFYFIGKILLFLMKLCHYYWSKLLKDKLRTDTNSEETIYKNENP
jgi:hypothetical protein